MTSAMDSLTAHGTVELIGCSIYLLLLSEPFSYSLSDDLKSTISVRRLVRKFGRNVMNLFFLFPLSPLELFLNFTTTQRPVNRQNDLLCEITARQSYFVMDQLTSPHV